MSGPIVLVQLGEPVLETRARVGTYSLWFQRAISEPLGVVDLRDPEQELPEDVAGVIFMGSPASVTEDHPWLPRALDAARRVLNGGVPTLGVCFGHQLFCVAQGGRVARNEVVEVGTVEVEMTPEAASDPLFGQLPQRYAINSSHDDTIAELPTESPPQLLGRSEREQNMVLRWGPQAWSVQYHPEMRRDETKFSIFWRTPRVEEEGGDADALLEACHDAPAGAELLQRFVDLVRGQQSSS
jgi:GMP synthase (glutamine-hydrolysing)